MTDLVKCYRCKLEKPIIDFGFRNEKKNLHYKICKECREKTRINKSKTEVDEKSKLKTICRTIIKSETKTKICPKCGKECAKFVTLPHPFENFPDCCKNCQSGLKKLYRKYKLTNTDLKKIDEFGKDWVNECGLEDYNKHCINEKMIDFYISFYVDKDYRNSEGYICEKAMQDNVAKQLKAAGLPTGTFEGYGSFNEEEYVNRAFRGSLRYFARNSLSLEEGGEYIWGNYINRE